MRRAPGSEAEPYIPESLPRERFRAGIIKELCGQPGVMCDWTQIEDESKERWIRLDNPLSGDYAWKSAADRPSRAFGQGAHRVRGAVAKAARRCIGGYGIRASFAFCTSPEASAMSPERILPETLAKAQRNTGTARWRHAASSRSSGPPGLFQQALLECAVETGRAPAFPFHVFVDEDLEYPGQGTPGS